MAMLTRYARKALLDHVLGTAAFAKPTTYLGLFTSDPTEAGALISELAGSGYSRLSLTPNLVPTALLTGQALNNSLMTFGPATAGWGGVGYWGVMDAPTAGNMLIFGPLVTAFVVQAGDSLPVSEGTLVLQLR